MAKRAPADKPRRRPALACRLQSLREAKELTRAQVAAALGIKAPSVHDWENGSTKPSIDHLPGLAELYGVSLADLLGAKAA